METTQALIKHPRTNDGLTSVAPVTAPSHQTQTRPPLTDELVDQLLEGRGLRGWFRAARVSMVLGLLSFYLFLDTYDIRADFNRRTIQKLRELARQANRRERLNLWIRSCIYEAVDRLIRALRYVVFRGTEGSARKDARLEKQAVWLRESLINLGPTFIKIGQALVLVLICYRFLM